MLSCVVLSEEFDSHCEHFGLPPIRIRSCGWVEGGWKIMRVGGRPQKWRAVFAKKAHLYFSIGDGNYYRSTGQRSIGDGKRDSGF